MIKRKSTFDEASVSINGVTVETRCTHHPWQHICDGLDPVGRTGDQFLGEI